MFAVRSLHLAVRNRKIHATCDILLLQSDWVALYAVKYTNLEKHQALHSFVREAGYVRLVTTVMQSVNCGIVM